MESNNISEAQIGIWFIDSQGDIRLNTLNNTPAGMGGTPYWWGIVADPGDGTAAQPAARLQRISRDHVERSARERGGDNPIHPLTPEEVEALRSLGYGS